MGTKLILVYKNNMLRSKKNDIEGFAVIAWDAKRAWATNQGLQLEN
jgi:hypothetical protein